MLPVGEWYISFNYCNSLWICNYYKNYINRSSNILEATQWTVGCTSMHALYEDYGSDSLWDLGEAVSSLQASFSSSVKWIGWFKTPHSSKILGLYAYSSGEVWISLGSSEKAMAPHSSTLAWKIPWMEESGRLQSMGSLRVRYDWATSLSLFTFMHWRRKWQPTPGFLPGESQGRGSLVGCCLWGRTESDTTEVT